MATAFSPVSHLRSSSVLYASIAPKTRLSSPGRPYRLQFWVLCLDLCKLEVKVEFGADFGNVSASANYVKLQLQGAGRGVSAVNKR